MSATDERYTPVWVCTLALRLAAAPRFGIDLAWAPHAEVTADRCVSKAEDVSTVAPYAGDLPFWLNPPWSQMTKFTRIYSDWIRVRRGFFCVRDDMSTAWAKAVSREADLIIWLGRVEYLKLPSGRFRGVFDGCGSPSFCSVLFYTGDDWRDVLARAHAEGYSAIPLHHLPGHKRMKTQGLNDTMDNAMSSWLHANRERPAMDVLQEALDGYVAEDMSAADLAMRILGLRADEQGQPATTSVEPTVHTEPRLLTPYPDPNPDPQPRTRRFDVPAPTIDAHFVDGKKKAAKKAPKKAAKKKTAKKAPKATQGEAGRSSKRGKLAAAIDAHLESGIERGATFITQELLEQIGVSTDAYHRKQANEHLKTVARVVRVGRGRGAGWKKVG